MYLVKFIQHRFVVSVLTGHTFYGAYPLLDYNFLGTNCIFRPQLNVIQSFV